MIYLTHEDYKRLRALYATGEFVNNEVERHAIGFIARSDKAISELAELSDSCCDVEDISFPPEYYCYRVFSPVGLPYSDI